MKKQERREEKRREIKRNEKKEIKSFREGEVK